MQRPQKQVFFIAAATLLFVGNLLFAQAILAQNVALMQVQEQSVAIHTEMNELKVKAAVLTSNENILRRAKELGFTATPKVVYLVGSEVLARNE